MAVPLLPGSAVVIMLSCSANACSWLLSPLQVVSTVFFSALQYRDASVFCQWHLAIDAPGVFWGAISFCQEVVAMELWQGNAEWQVSDLVFKRGTMLTRRNMESALWKYKSTSGEGERSSGSKAWNSLYGTIEIILFVTVTMFLYCNPVYIKLIQLLDWIF